MVAVIFSAQPAIKFIQLQEEEEDDDQEFFRTGHEKQEFVCFSKAHRCMTRNKRRTVDL